MTDEDLPPTFDHEHIALGVVSAGDMTTRRRKVHLDTMTPTSSRRTDDSALDLDHDECLDFIKLAFDFARPSFVDDVHELCGGNLRHARGYWHGILASESMYENLQAKGKEHFGIYDHWDSLITGHHRVHHRRRSRLRNVFYAVPDSRRPRDLLIGYHLLQILHEEKGDQPSYISIDKKMEQYGYRQDEIFEALNYYVGYLIKLGSNEMPRPFRIRKGVVKAYLRLVTEPAYLDNLAMVTPVDEVVRNQMVQTDSFAPSDFLNRVYTTLGFLWQIHLDEKWFCNPSSCEESVESDAFESVLNVNRLPRLFPVLTTSYGERIQVLREQGRLPRSVTDEEWDILLRDRVFREAEGLEGKKFLEVYRD